MMKRWFGKNIVPRFEARGYICEDTFRFKNKADDLLVHYDVRRQLGVMEFQLFLSVRNTFRGWFTCTARRYCLSATIDDFAATRDKEEYKAHISRITDQLFDFALAELEEIAGSISYLEERHYDLLSRDPHRQAEGFAQRHGLELCLSLENYGRLNDWILGLRPEERKSRKEAFEECLADLIPCAAFLGEMIMTRCAGEWNWAEIHASDWHERKFGVIFPPPPYSKEEDGVDPLSQIAHVWNFGGVLKSAVLSPPRMALKTGNDPRIH